MPQSSLIIFCTCPDRNTAEALARLLVSNQLAACVNIVANLISIYSWQGQIESAEECLLLIKAHQDNYPAIETALRQHHPYALPEIIAVAIQQGLPDYLHWINTCTPAK
jgi:periplasmic divalent cation tolerance protein